MSQESGVRSEELRDSERRAKRLTNKLQLFSEDSRSTFHCAVLKVRSARKAGSEAKARQARAGQAEAKQLTERPEKAVREGSRTGKTDRKPTERRPFTIPVTIARGNHLYPSRTQKLSLLAPKVLGWQRPGRSGRRRIPSRQKRKCFCLLHNMII